MIIVEIVGFYMKDYSLMNIQREFSIGRKKEKI
jgi:hypothetical protein